MNYIKERYDLPFLEVGMKVEADGKPGTIKREKNGYIEIVFENGKTGLAHPTWEMVYYDENGKVIKDFRTVKKKYTSSGYESTPPQEESKNTIEDSGMSWYLSSGSEAAQSDFDNSSEHFSGFGSDDGGSFGGGGASGSWDSSNDYSSSDSSSYDSSSDF